MSEQTVALVAAVVEGLEPLADATPGEPVRADEWNTVVSAVIDIARIALASEQSAAERIDARFAPAEHDHLGAVGPDWLDAVAREQLDGSRNRFDLEQELVHANRTMTEISNRLDGIVDDIDSLRRRLLTVEDNDLGRHQRLERVATSVDSFGEQTTQISNVQSSLHGLQTQVGMALKLRSELTDEAGEPIDLVGIRTTVSDLAADRKRLLDAAGEVLDARAVEQRIARLETRLPSGGDGTGTVPDFDVDRFRGELLGEVDTRFETRVDPLDAELADTRADLGDLRGTVDSGRADIDAVGGRLQTAEQGLSAVRTATQGIPELTTRVGQVESRAAGNATRLAGMDALAGRVDGIDSTLAVFDGVPERVGQIDARLRATEAATGRLPALEGQVASLSGLRANLEMLSARVDQIGTVANRSVVSADALSARLTEVEAGSIDLRTRFAKVERTQQTQATSLNQLNDRFVTINRPGIIGGGRIS